MPPFEPVSSPHPSLQASCALCGLPIGRSSVNHLFDGRALPFCCPGCRQVYVLLAGQSDLDERDFRETDIFKTCQTLGIIPRGTAEAEPENDVKAGGKTSCSIRDLSCLLTLQLEGMWCTACSWLIEEVLKRQAGVLDARVTFFTDEVEVRYLPHVITPEAIRHTIADLGYRPSPEGVESAEAAEEKALLIRLGVSAILTANVMMISFGLYSGFWVALEPEIVRGFSGVLWALTTPVVFYGGLPILRRAAGSLRHGAATMETLISLGSLAAYGASLMNVVTGSLHVYFDTAAMLVTLVLLGKFIETRARRRVARSITELRRLARGKVRLRQDDGRERWVTSEAAAPGDLFILDAGETSPLDGVIREGEALVDASFLTGESRPLRRRSGDDIQAGVRVLEGRLTVKTLRNGEESTLGRMVALIGDALSHKGHLELLADRLTRRLVPAIVLLAVGCALILAATGLSTEAAFLRALTVLVITCPCALGIATPLAKVAAMGVARSRGLVVHNPEALERAGSLDVLVLDKTGTVTEGRFALRREAADSSLPREALLRAALLERHSSHVLGRTLVARARDEGLALNAPVDEIQEFAGLGITGRVEGQVTAVGNRRLLSKLGWDVPKGLEAFATEAEAEGLTTVYVGWEGRARAVFALGDTIKEGAKKALQTLQERRVTLWLLSGDAVAVTEKVARKLGIDSFRGEALPEDKVAVIRKLQGQGRRVGMVGDGLNDAAALAQADVGFSLGAGAHLLEAASDVALLSDHPAQVLPMMDLAKLTTRIIRQNFLFAFAYNALGIPLALAGALNPILAVCAMFASSLTVIVNTLRIQKHFSSKESHEDNTSKQPLTASLSRGEEA